MTLPTWAERAARAAYPTYRPAMVTGQHEQWSKIHRDFRSDANRPGGRLVMVPGAVLVPWHGPSCTYDHPDCWGDKIPTADEIRTARGYMVTRRAAGVHDVADSAELGAFICEHQTAFPADWQRAARGIVRAATRGDDEQVRRFRDQITPR